MSLERFTRKDVVTVGPDETVQAAAQAMRSRHVGAVVVVAEGRPVGIVTDRDLALRLVADGHPATTPVRELMTEDPVTCHVEDTLDAAIAAIRRHGVRRLPILDDHQQLVGLVAIDDLLVLLNGEASAIVEAVLDNRGP
jgi:CBS domain-containing protein